MDNIKFFDVNCMIGQWHEKHLQFADVKGLLTQMNRFHISEALVSHTRSWLSDPVEGNEALVKEVADYPNLHPVIALTPLLDEEFGGVQRLSGFVQENRVAAIRLFSKDHGFSLHPFNQKGIFTFAGEAGLPIILDFFQLDSNYETFYELLKAFPEVTVILSEPCHRQFRVLFDLHEQCPNLLFDMSVFNGYHELESYVARFGSRRLLYGTKMPFVEGSLGAGLLAYSDISDTDKENIAWNNAVQLFGERRDSYV